MVLSIEAAFGRTVVSTKTGGKPPRPPAHDHASRQHERLRIARELDDSTSELLTTLQAEIAAMNRMNGNGSRRILEECEETIRIIREQIRALRLDSA